MIKVNYNQQQPEYDEESLLMGGSSKTSIGIKHVGVTVNPCCRINPGDRYNVAVYVLNGILKQDSRLQLLRYANFINSYGPNWANLSTIIYILQYIAMIVICVLLTSSKHMVIFSLLVSIFYFIYNSLMYAVMFKNYLKNWERSIYMIPLNENPTPSKFNLIYRVSVENIETFGFLHQSQKQQILGYISKSGKTSMEFNFYSPIFVSYLMSCPIRTVFVLSLIWLFLLIAVIYYIVIVLNGSVTPPITSSLSSSSYT